MLQPFQWMNGKPTSAADVARQRQIADALLAQNGSPGNIGEGLSAIGRALAYRGLTGQAAEAEREGRRQYNELFAALGGNPSQEQLMGIAGNDFATPGQTAVVNALLAKQLDPNAELDRQLKQIQVNQAGLDFEQDMAGQADDPTKYYGTPIAIQTPDGIKYGLPGEDGSFKPLDIGEGNTFAPTTRTVDTGTELLTVGPGGEILERIPKENALKASQEAVGKGLGENQIEIIDAGRSARGNNAKLDLLEETLGNAPQGLQGAFVQAAGQIGIPMEGLDDLQAANAIINQLVPLQRAPGSGTMSDRDLELFKQSLPAIINQPGGNKKIIATMRALNDYADKHGDIELRLALGKINETDAQKERDAIPNPLANFKAQTQDESLIPNGVDLGTPAMGGDGIPPIPDAYKDTLDPETWKFMTEEQRALFK